MKAKRILSALLTAIIFVTSLMCVTVPASAEKEYSGNIISEYIQNDKNDIAISASKIKDYAYLGNKNIAKVTLENSVETIGAGAFYNSSVNEIEMTDSVTKIDEFAFFECAELEKITLSKNINKIDKSVFWNCKKLKSIVIPENVTEIEAFAFYCCESLQEIIIPSGVTDIGEYAFGSCANLKSIYIPNGVKNIDKNAFNSDKNLTIYGSDNSYAKKYAKENNIPFFVGTSSDFGKMPDSSSKPSATESAVSNKKLKLLTVPVTDISKSGILKYCGNSIYVADDGFVRIGETEIAEWRKTGKLKPTKIKCDYSFPKKYSGNVDLDSGSYFMIFPIDNNGNRSSDTVLKYDEKKNKITTVRTYKDNKLRFCTSDGYIINAPVINEKKKTFTITVDTPNGKSFSTSFKTEMYANAEKPVLGYVFQAENDNNYLYYVFTLSNPGKNEGFNYTMYTMNNYLVDRKGKKIKAGEKRGGAFNYDFKSGALIYTGWGGGYAANYNIYLTNSDKGFDFIDTYDSDTNANIMYVSSVYGERMIGTYQSDKITINKLLGIGKAEYRNYDCVIAISNSYKSIYTLDGKIYCVQSMNDKWGYIDSNGKELSLSFNDAGAFAGKYAPVVKKGKAYLINDKMKTASDSVAADSVYTYADGLYRIQKGETKYLFTYK